MCGINTIFNFRGGGAVDREELRRTRDAMTARGPDGFGEWFSGDGHVGLGHRRLSIIDLSQAGRQPMSTRDGRYTITFNGEIYNYQKLRSGIERTRGSFASESDTEVILEMFRAHGPDMLTRLRGMFAFAIWDAETRELFLARDPYGIKPLYYSTAGGVFRAASQVKALLAGGKVSREMDVTSMAGFLMTGSVPEPGTACRDIRALPAGHWMIVGEDGIREAVEYFSIAETMGEGQKVEGAKSRGGEEDVFAEAAEALRDSVAQHMIADVPVGAFLSAGIDSGSLVGLVRDAGITELETVTLAFEEFQGLRDDEAPLAAEVAGHYGTDHRTRMLGAEEFGADLEHILHVMDQPSIDGINTYYVSKAATENGLKVALSGLGGDELFAGYNTFIDVPRWVGKFSAASSVPLLGKSFRRLYATLVGTRGVRSPKVAGILEYGGTWPGAWLLRRGLFMPWELPALMGADEAEAALKELNIIGRIEEAMRPDPGTAWGRVAAMESSLYMRNQLLRDSDWAGMAHSLELRVPLVDAFLLRTLAPLLSRHALTYRKKLLAAAPTRSIPDHILNREKTGFQVPIRGWLESNPAIDAWKSVPQLAQRGCPWERRWAYTLFDRIVR